MAGKFDEFVLKAKDIADAAGKKTNELYEISKSKYECIKLNGEIKKLYEQLGSSVYSMVKGGYDNDELVDSLTEEIDECMEQLRLINEELAQRKNERVCPACAAKNPMDNFYCAKCGTKLKREEKPADPDVEPDCGCGEDFCEAPQEPEI